MHTSKVMNELSHHWFHHPPANQKISRACLFHVNVTITHMVRGNEEVSICSMADSSSHTVDMCCETRCAEFMITASAKHRNWSLECKAGEIMHM